MAMADNLLSQAYAQHQHSERTQKEAIQNLFIFTSKSFIIFIAPLHGTSNRELGETAASFPHSQPFCILIPQLLHWLYGWGLRPSFPPLSILCILSLLMHFIYFHSVPCTLFWRNVMSAVSLAAITSIS